MSGGDSLSLASRRVASRSPLLLFHLEARVDGEGAERDGVADDHAERGGLVAAEHLEEDEGGGARDAEQLHRHRAEHADREEAGELEDEAEGGDGEEGKRARGDGGDEGGARRGVAELDGERGEEEAARLRRRDVVLRLEERQPLLRDQPS